MASFKNSADLADMEDDTVEQRYSHIAMENGRLWAIIDTMTGESLCLIDRTEDPDAEHTHQLTLILNGVSSATDDNMLGIAAISGLVGTYRQVFGFFSDLTDCATDHENCAFAAKLAAAAPESWPLPDILYIPSEAFLEMDVEEGYTATPLPEAERALPTRWDSSESAIPGYIALRRPELPVALHFYDSDAGESHITVDEVVQFVTSAIDACACALPQDPAGIAIMLPEILDYLNLAHEWHESLKAREAKATQRSSPDFGDFLAAKAQSHGLDWKSLGIVLQTTTCDMQPHVPYETPRGRPAPLPLQNSLSLH